MTAHSQTMPDAAARGDDVAVAWQSDANYHLEIVAAVSKDGGRTFPPEVKVAGAENEIHREPAVAWGPAGELYVIWQALTDNLDYDILLSVSTDKGKTFSAPVRVNRYKKGNQLFPAIAVAPGGALHAAWHDNLDNTGSYHIYTAISEDGGKTFSNETRISGDNALNLWPSICADENRVAIAWQGGAAGGFEIFASVSFDGGKSFSAPASPPGREGRDRQYAGIAAEGRELQLVWSEIYGIERPPGDEMYRYPRSQSDIYFSKYDGKEGFSEPVRINGYETGQKLRPDILPIGGGESVVVWFDSLGGDFNIFISLGSGGRFNEERYVNEERHGDSRNPRLAFSAGTVVAVWQSDFEGDYEIYCNRISLGIFNSLP